MLARALVALLASALLGSAPTASSQDWGNYGGGPARNGRSALIGPTAATLAWENDDDFSLISWMPFIEGERVFTIREAGFPQSGGAANDALIAYDIDDGSELWRTTLSFGGNTSTEWIAWCGGVNGGRVYASRSSNLQPQPLKAFDASNGALLWTSTLATEAWAHDGLVFASDGDVIIADRLVIARLDATNGQVVWQTPRSCPVSGACGAAATDTAVFIDEPGPGGNVITKLDIATGAVLYSSSLMIGFTDQNTPFLSPDGGTVYMSRTQNNPLTDFLYAFEDTGSALVEKWNREVRWTTQHEHGLGVDGSIYTFLPNDEFVRLDPADGGVIDTAGVLAPLGSPKTAVDATGNVYISNGWASSPASDGRLWGFSSDLSTTLFTLLLDRQNSGGPALGTRGTLVVADRQGVYAYRNPTWTDLGLAKAGTGNVVPVVSGTGSLAANTSGTLDLIDALPSTTSTLVVGFADLSAPFKGGTLVPTPDIFIGPLVSSGTGNITLPFVFPAGVPSDFDFYVQHWISDPGATFGLSSSNGLQGTTP